MAYASIRAEFNTHAFVAAVLHTGKMLVLPRVDSATQQLVLHQVNNIAALRIGPYGIPEPDAGCPQIMMDDVDFALLPGVAFDRNLNRLGYGGGYYDRLLSKLHNKQQPFLVSAAFSFAVAGMNL